MSVVELGRFMEDLAQASGKAILPFFRAQFALEDKARGGSPFDPVTEADRAAEVVLRAMIAKAFPGHGILGEEFGTEREDAECVWVLDPIDGTRAFIAGLPTWGTLIGLTRNGVPVRGLMHQPYLGEVFTGDGHSARLRGPAGERTLRTRRCARSRTGAAGFHRSAPVRGRRGGGAVPCPGRAGAPLALRHRLLRLLHARGGPGRPRGRGGAEALRHLCLIPIVEGAGGRVTSWDGGSAAKGGRVIAAGDPRLHEAALKVLNP